MRKYIICAFIVLVAFCSLLCGCDNSDTGKVTTEPVSFSPITNESTPATTNPTLKTIINGTTETEETSQPLESVPATLIPDASTEQTETFVEDDEDSLGWS